MKTKLKRSAALLTACLPAIIYVIWLNAYYWLLEAGRYQSFIQPKLWPLLILALVLLLAFAAASFSGLSSKTGTPLRWDVWVKAAILVVPAVFLWTIYGQSLGADAFVKRLVGTDQGVFRAAAGLNPKPSEGFAGRAETLLDLILYAEKFNGQRVAVEGMVYRGAAVEDNSFKLFRFAVACCAADALPFSVRVKTPATDHLPNDTWVRVEGLFSLAALHDKKRASILADTVLPIPAPPPEQRYLFF
jgi:uncharacterized repeat protein (TIGR03943 family)